MNDYSELKRLAEAATPGTWQTELEYPIIQPAYPARGSIASALIWQDAHFIAAANPAAVLALIAEVESLREHKQLLVDLREADGYESWASVLVMVDKLKAENEDLRKDAERYRFIRRSGGLIWTVIESQKKATGDLYDVGVDAAMSKGEQP